MPNLTQEDIEEEQRHFAEVVATFQQYASYSLAANNRRRKDLFVIPKSDLELLTSLGYRQKLADVDKAILANAEFLNQIVASPEIFGHDISDDEEDEGNLSDDADQHEENKEGTSQEAGPTVPSSTSGQGQSRSHSHSHSHDGPSHSHSHGEPSSGHTHSHDHGRPRKFRAGEPEMDKLRSTLKQFVRDWSEEGKIERDVTYEPMKQALLEHFSDIPLEERHNFRVLVPGAGLGRLAWDVAHLGFSCQGNEFSHYMLLASFFILNRTKEINQHTIYPYIHTFSNMPNKTALLRPITIPDVNPSDLPPQANFSLVAGDFEEIYGTESDEDEPQAGQWDAILTCFFIDTAKNIVNYLRIMHRILAPGGVWINLGPLLWHWENNTTNDPSVELDLEEVKELARKIGFEIKNEKTIDVTYTNNAQSMLGYTYNTAFWTATKIV
ncbi:N2227-domain-containing protein [Panus rudis PR-1116 ss-1]|nr:N2227-domain-containing protein [Panus rudis PR-1116 ss-1]